MAIASFDERKKFFSEKHLLLEKGKPSERVGRKATGLSLPDRG